MVRVLLFAQASAIAGTDSCDWPIAGPCGVSEFWGWLLGLHPDLAALREVCRLACNGEYLEADGLIFSGDELAVIPPVSGG